MKYIDAEKLIALIDSKLEDLGMSGSVWVGRSVLQELKNDIITSLQQEQSKVDLEKELDKFYGMYRDKNGVTHDMQDNEICLDWKEGCNDLFIIEFAKHFFELGLKAKQG